MDEWKKKAHKDSEWYGCPCKKCRLHTPDKKAMRRRVRARMKASFQKKVKKFLDRR